MSLDLPTYRGAPVLDWEPNMDGDSGTLNFASNRKIVDGQVGPMKYDRPSALASRTSRTPTYLLETRQQLLDARAFMTDIAGGRWKGFWVPTWTQDLFLAAPAAADDTTLTITRVNFAALYGDVAGGRQHLALFPHVVDVGPLLVPRMITGVTVDDDTEILTLDSAIGHALDVDDLCSFLLYSRADADVLALVWESMVTGTMALPLIDLPTETP